MMRRGGPNAGGTTLLFEVSPILVGPLRVFLTYA